jgi:hypothetical protein
MLFPDFLAPWQHLFADHADKTLNSLTNTFTTHNLHGVFYQLYLGRLSPLSSRCYAYIYLCIDKIKQTHLIVSISKKILFKHLI